MREEVVGNAVVRDIRVQLDTVALLHMPKHRLDFTVSIIKF